MAVSMQARIRRGGRERGMRRGVEQERRGNRERDSKSNCPGCGPLPLSLSLPHAIILRMLVLEVLAWEMEELPCISCLEWFGAKGGHMAGQRSWRAHLQSQKPVGGVQTSTGSSWVGNSQFYSYLEGREAPFVICLTYDSAQKPHY